jgi:hypothetical protein
MVTERSDARKSYPSLPMRDSRKENSALPAINVQMEQLNRQLTQLIEHLNRLNHQMQIFHENSQATHSSHISQITTSKTAEDSNDKDKKYQTAEIILSRMRRQKTFYKYGNRIFIFFLVIGVVAALISGLVLFYRGPAMI